MADDPNDPINQEDIDALLAAEAPSEDPSQVDDAAPESDNSEEVESAAEAVQPDAAPDDTGIDQAAIDALMSGSDDTVDAEVLADDAPISDQGLDEVLGADTEANQSDVDAILNAEAAAPSPTEDSAEPSSAADSEVEVLIPQDFAEALLQDAEADADVESAVGSENVTAGAEVTGQISQDVIDQLVGAAIDSEPEEIIVESSAIPTPVAGAAPLAEKEPEADPKPKPQTTGPTFPERLAEFTNRHGIKIVASLAAGIAVAAATYGALIMNPTQHIPARQVLRIATVPLESIVRRARELNAEGAYGESLQLLEPALATAPRDTYHTDVEFLRIEAYYKALPSAATPEEMAKLINDIDRFLVEAPDDTRAGQALFWQGRLYEKQHIPFAARQVFERLLRSYANAPNRDQIMIEIARLSLEIGQNKAAAEYLDRVLTEYPGSAVAGKARLLSGDIELALGNRDKARNTFQQIATAHPDSALAAEAYGRLGKMSFDEGNYSAAASLLETRRQLATSIDGNDKVFLQLAQAYRAEGRYDKAEEVLRELIDFFPESDIQPQAYIELSQVLDARGERGQAVILAEQAAERFSENPFVSENAGDQAARAGDTRGAARYYEQADAMGAGSADVLLKAGMQHMEAGKDLQAAEVFTRLLEFYPASPEAAEAGIALAETHYTQGRTAEAVDQLTKLMATTEGQPQRLPVLRALGAIYSDLGLRDEAGEVYAELANLSREPQIMADSARALLEAGRIEQAYQLINEIPIDRLEADTAYNLLYAEARTRIRANPDEAIKVMRRAHDRYPTARTELGEEQLFRAYLSTSQVPQARAMLSELEREVVDKPTRGRVLRERALLWADYHYDRGDYKTAVDGYDLVLKTQGSLKEDDVHWARYQRANALFARNDVTDALIALEEIAEAASPWSEAARAKAESIRLDARIRNPRVAQSS